MRKGELWWFNNRQIHEARNDGDGDRIHLIFDLLPATRRRKLTGNCNRKARVRTPSGMRVRAGKALSEHAQRIRPTADANVHLNWITAALSGARHLVDDDQGRERRVAPQRWEHRGVVLPIPDSTSDTRNVSPVVARPQTIIDHRYFGIIFPQ